MRATKATGIATRQPTRRTPHARAETQWRFFGPRGRTSHSSSRNSTCPRRPPPPAPPPPHPGCYLRLSLLSSRRKMKKTKRRLQTGVNMKVQQQRARPLLLDASLVARRNPKRLSIHFSADHPPPPSLHHRRRWGLHAPWHSISSHKLLAAQRKPSHRLQLRAVLLLRPCLQLQLQLHAPHRLCRRHQHHPRNRY